METFGGSVDSFVQLRSVVQIDDIGNHLSPGIRKYIAILVAYID